MTRREFLPFAPPCLGPEDEAAVVDALRSGWLAAGPRARRFEEEFAALVGADAALALNSCTAGLHTALVAAGVGPGDAVVTSPWTFVGTLNAIEQARATPVLADVDGDTLNLSPARVDEAIERATRDGLRVRALLPVHFAGHACDLGALTEIAAARGLVVVEDAAHALPSRVGDRFVGAPIGGGVTSFASFSFYANKNLTTAEGGMLVGPRELIARAQTFAHQGFAQDDGVPSWRREAVSAGFKYAMSDVAAALGLAQLAKLERFHARRREIAARYAESLADVDAVELPAVRPGFGHAWHLYVIHLRLERLTIDRDGFVEELAARNVGASVHFRPVHRHRYWRERLGDVAVQLPVAEAAAPRVVSLPLHPAMTDADVDDVVDAVVDVVLAHRR